MDRRDFLKSATLATAATAATAALESAVAQAPSLQLAQAAPVAAAKKLGEPQMKRWTEQRWLLDNIIRANGIDWDQPRTAYLNGPCGVEANADFAGIRARVQKYADIGPAFEAVARRREAKAHEAEAANSPVSARENYFMAAVHWGAAQWPIDETNDLNVSYNQKKRECFSKYAGLADHRIEEVWVPFQGKALPAWLHLPYNYSGGRVPAVVSIPGMDSFKEANVAMYGDRWLNRGVAVLAVEGPGQYEAAILGIYVTVPGWAEAGRAFMDWMQKRPEIDPQRIGVVGSSFGTFCSTIVAGADARYRACAQSGTHHEPGGFVHDEEASPTFKRRFMWMSGYTDEAQYDEFAKTLTLDKYAADIRMPFLCLAGEADELSPMVHTENLFKLLKGPKRLVVYQDSRHSVGGVPAANLGPAPAGLVADWMTAQLTRGESFPNERWYVEASGRVVKTAM